MSIGPQMPAKQKLVTQQQYDQALAQFDAQAAAGTTDSEGANPYAGKRQELMDSMLVPPAPPPDVSDQLVQQKALLARRRLLLGGGLTGPLNITPGAVSTPVLTGS